MIREIWTKHKLAVGVIAGIAVLAVEGIVQNRQEAAFSAASGEQMQALDSALKNGLITEDEYNGKVKSLKGGDHVTGASATASGGLRQMKTVEVLDPFFGQRAFTLTIPEDWKFEGTVLRAQNGAAQLVFRASSADGLTGVQQLPEYNWEWSDDLAYMRFVRASKAAAFPPMPAADFAKKVVIPEARPNAQVEEAEPIPGLDDNLAAQDRKENEQLAAMSQPGGKPSTVHSDAARVRIQYEFKGHAEEEWIGVITSTQEMPGMGRTIAVRSLSHASVSGSRARLGQLDRSMEIFKQIGSSVREDPGWHGKQVAFLTKQLQRQTAHVTNQAQAFTEQMLHQSAAWRAGQQAKFEASMNAAKAMSEASHQSAMATAEHMGDVQSMVDPAKGRTGQVSNQYNYSYANQDGSVGQTNSPTLNPNAQLRGNWTQLEPIKPQ